MITDLWIENFKGISKRQHIPLRPVTLLFGVNSAGKSTVLHALLYLRELLCRDNINPTKPIAGENTVNLGGLANLRHKAPDRQGDNAPIRLGCRFSVDFEKVRNAENLRAPVWEQSHYQSETSFYAVLRHVSRRDISSGNTLQPELPLDYDPEWGDSVFCEVRVTIGGEHDGMPSAVSSFEWNVDDANLLTSWRAHDGQSCCWLNAFHPRLLPVLHGAYANAANLSWSHYISGCLANLRQRLHSLMLLGYSMADDDFWLAIKGSYLVVRNPLHCPELPMAVESIAGFLLAAEQTMQWLETRYVSLSQVLDHCEPLVGSDGQDSEYTDVFLAIDETQIFPIESAYGGVEAARFLAIPSSRISHVPAIIEKLRFAILRDALAGDFSINTNTVGLPRSKGILLSVSDDTGAQVGESLIEMYDRVAEWFPQQLARIDQTIRIGLMQLRRELERLCYVGPKRSMVPRNLTEQVLDEYSHWGNGLGAWRWMLKAGECSESQMQQCSHWLGNSETGIGTRYELVRTAYYELTHEQLVTSYNEGGEFSDLSGFNRIQLRDHHSKVIHHPQDVGEGITQVIPVIAACVKSTDSRSVGQILIVEQPELHLHPSMTARVGDLFLCTAFAAQQGPYFEPASIMVETHSEHLILRILRRIRQTTNDELPEHIPPLKPDDVCVLWVDNLGDGTTFQRLRIDDQGEFIDRWPQGFFSERAEELY